MDIEPAFVEQARAKCPEGTFYVGDMTALNTVCRMSRTLVDGTTSRLEFEYLIGRSSGIERRRETHTLALFTQSQMEAAFAGADLTATRKPEVLRTRGLYIAQSEADGGDRT